MTSFARVDPSQVIGLLLALGIGLLIGLERERHKGEEPKRSPLWAGKRADSPSVPGCWPGRPRIR